MHTTLWKMALLGTMMTTVALTGCEGSFESDETDESDELSGELASVQRAWASGTFDGDLGFRLSWRGSADLDLYVKTPRGEVLSFQARRDSAGGAWVRNACTAAACRGQASEEAGWVNAAPTGRYEVWAGRDNSSAAQEVMIEVSRAGAIEDTFMVTDLDTARGSRSSSFFVDVAELPIESKFNGELGVQLSWSGSADLDLFVISPTGEQISFQRRTDSLGGALTKNNCLLTSCQHTASEEVVWNDTSPRGVFKVRIANYNGAAARDVKVRVHNRRQIIESFDVVVPARRSASVDAPDFVFDTTPVNPQGLEFTSHADEAWQYGPSTTLSLAAGDPSIERVTLSVNGRDVGTRTVAEGLSFAHTFAQLGEQSVDAIGLNGDGMVVSLKQLKMVVTDAQGGLPRRRTGGARDVSRALLAKRIHSLMGIELFTQLFDSRYRTDERNGRFADSNNNVLDASRNNTSARSCYGNAPCGRAFLDEEMLQALLLIHQRHGYRLHVSTIVGGSHSRTSRHYDGLAFDVNYINGTKISTGTRTLNRQVTELCRQYGATEILQPPDAGHSGHIHCAWPRR